MAVSLTASRPRLIRMAYVVVVGVAMIGWAWVIVDGLAWMLGV
jgi:hypothetical protein